MTVRELREKYLAFFESKGHRRFPSGSLVPIDVTGKLDESLLFNGAGMIQFKPYFRGIATPEHPKLTTVQKCVRTNDIDEVGDATHLSFFEMLGNFSFGDYFKNQAIDYSWEFLTSPEWLGLDPRKLAFTIFESDEEAYDAWSLHLRGAGIDPETRIFRLDEETNYWPAGAFSKGPPGPCGPNSEMFYWTSDEEPPVARPSRSSVSPTVPVEKRQGAFLPHWTADGATYLVTFRLADAVPASKREEWKTKRDAFRQLEAEGKTRVRESLEFHKAFSENVDAYLDAGDGFCLLRDPKAAQIVQNALKHFDGERYRLLAWVVMPNHVHAVVEPLPGYELSQILHSWKSFSAHEINKALGRSGDVWMDESYDHLVRDEKDLARVVDYTLENPEKARLGDWPYVGSMDTGTVSDTLDRDGRATYSKEDFLRDDAAGNWVEIWNDVFIQYEWQGHPDPSGKGYVKDGMPELPFRSIDTGMGLDRTAFVLAGKKSVYENGSFDGIFRILNELTGDNLDYATDPSPKGQAARIVADHVRNAAFCIADGILPGNTGRGYVVRRLIRRAVLKGQRTLSLSEPFLYQAFEGVVETMGDFYTELDERRATIVETLRNEEQAFRRTLERGLELLTKAFVTLFVDQVAKVHGTTVDPAGVMERVWSPSFKFKTEDGIDQLPAEIAYRLYDQEGFPYEVTLEIAGEKGLTIDEDAFKRLRNEGAQRSRGAQGEKSAYGSIVTQQEAEVLLSGAFTNYDPYRCTEVTTKVVGIRVNTTSEGRTAQNFEIALADSPLYVESGGQTADIGTILWNHDIKMPITGSYRDGKLIWLEVMGVYWQRDRDRTDQKIEEGLKFSVAEEISPVSPDFSHYIGLHPKEGVEWLADQLLEKMVTATVDKGRRHKIQRNHTATHFLQASLRETLGSHVAQAGSYVGPDRLRFDFAHGKALTPQEIETVERRVVERILANEDVTTYADLPIAEAKARGAMALFGEKYGDKVRMVEVGEFSRELCGGIHVRTAGEIGLFRIVSESSAAGGVRRIEAVTGEAAYELARAETNRIKEAAALLKASPADLVQAVERTLEAAKDAKRKQEKAERAALSGDQGGAQTTDVDGVTLWRRDFGDIDPKTAAAAVDDAAAQAPNGVTLAAVVSGGKVQFIAKAGAEAVAKGAHAGNLLKEVSRIAGGGGGGRAEFATAGGKDPAKVSEALAAAEAILKAQLG